MFPLTGLSLVPTARSSSGKEASAEEECLLSAESISKKIEERFVIVRIPSTGLRHFTGISSSYSTQFPPVLQGVLSQSEFVEVITKFNETIRDYWPCDTCYYFGYGCMLCTVGLSVLIPHYCVSHSERYAIAVLRNYSLKARYYDRKISFQLVKRCCQSFVEIRVPSQLISAELLAKHHGDPLIYSETKTALTYNNDLEQRSERGRIDVMDRGSPSPLVNRAELGGPVVRSTVQLTATSAALPITPQVDEESLLQGGSKKAL